MKISEERKIYWRTSKNDDVLTDVKESRIHLKLSCQERVTGHDARGKRILLTIFEGIVPGTREEEERARRWLTTLKQRL